MRMSLSIVLLCLTIAVPLTRGQQPTTQTQPQEEADEVVRINTDLVQTDITVVDKQERLLRVTITDRLANSSVSQSVSFDVE